MRLWGVGANWDFPSCRGGGEGGRKGVCKYYSIKIFQKSPRAHLRVDSRLLQYIITCTWLAVGTFRHRWTVCSGPVTRQWNWHAREVEFTSKVAWNPTANLQRKVLEGYGFPFLQWNSSMNWQSQLHVQLLHLASKNMQRVLVRSWGTAASGNLTSPSTHSLLNFYSFVYWQVQNFFAQQSSWTSIAIKPLNFPQQNE